MLAQLASVIVFDVVIDNADRWSGNNTQGSPDERILYFMDNTLAFSTYTVGHTANLSRLYRIQVFPRGLIGRLRTLTRRGGGGGAGPRRRARAAAQRGRDPRDPVAPRSPRRVRRPADRSTSARTPCWRCHDHVPGLRPRRRSAALAVRRRARWQGRRVLLGRVRGGRAAAARGGRARDVARDRRADADPDAAVGGAGAAARFGGRGRDASPAAERADRGARCIAGRWCAGRRRGWGRQRRGARDRQRSGDRESCTSPRRGW